MTRDNARIGEVLAWEALDSRGTPTVACAVTLTGGASGEAVVPSGASTGAHEAVELRDGGERYGGRGVATAAGNVTTVLGPAVRGMDAHDRAAVDAALVAADGSGDLGRLGANAVLAVSLATTIAAAGAAGVPLHRYLDPTGQPPLLPLPMVNILSGGAHAGRALDIQDVLAVPLGARSFPEAIEWTWRVRRAAAELLEEAGQPAGLVADEGGLAGRLPTNEAALELVHTAVIRAGLVPGEQVALAVDLAATQFAEGDGYRLAAEGRTLDRDAWIAEVARWCKDYDVVSVEDVLHEDDWDGWAAATRRLPPGVQLLGDDLFVTDLDRLRWGIGGGVANAVLVKPNQTGTVSAAEAVVAAATRAGYASVVSARSGDTEDSWLADLAIGTRAGQIKVGSLTRSERTAKWNRLLRVAAELGERATLAGPDTLGGRG